MSKVVWPGGNQGEADVKEQPQDVARWQAEKQLLTLARRRQK